MVPRGNMMHCMLKQVSIFAVVVVIVVFVVIVVVFVIVMVGYPIETKGPYEWCPVAT